MKAKKNSGVFGSERVGATRGVRLKSPLARNKRLRLEGLVLLGLLPDSKIPAAFLDPQYRGVLDKLAYGNEGEKRGQTRAALRQMEEATIMQFIAELSRVLRPSGHLFLWVDKFHLCEGIKPWLVGTELGIVDLVNWNKDKLGMGYRTRRVTEHCVVLQKKPHRAKGAWQLHDIRDTVTEKLNGASKIHPHTKPVELQSRLIEAVTSPGDLVVDPAAGSFSVLEAAHKVGRDFLGCDISPPPDCGSG